MSIQKKAVEVYQLLTYPALVELGGIVEWGTDLEPRRVHVRPLLKHGLIKTVWVEGYVKPYYVATAAGRAVNRVREAKIEDSADTRLARRLEKKLAKIREKKEKQA